MISMGKVGSVAKTRNGSNSNVAAQKKKSMAAAVAKKVAKPVAVNAAESSDGTADSTASLDSSTGIREVAADAVTKSDDERKSVRFSQIEIREYKRTLGDHPGTQAGGAGPPITIEWDHHASNVLDLDDYEKEFEKSKSSRRGKQELFMPGKVREKMLKDDHSAADMRRAQRDSWRIRNNRSMAVATQDMEHFEVAWQSAVRKFKRWRKKSSGEEPEPAEAWVDAFKNMSIEEREQVFGEAAKSRDTTLSSSMKSNASSEQPSRPETIRRAQTT